MARLYALQKLSLPQPVPFSFMDCLWLMHAFVWEGRFLPLSLFIKQKTKKFTSSWKGLCGYYRGNTIRSGAHWSLPYKRYQTEGDFMNFELTPCAAVEEGIHIVPMCGFDSVPSDLGAYCAANELYLYHLFHPFRFSFWMYFVGVMESCVGE